MSYSKTTLIAELSSLKDRMKVTEEFMKSDKFNELDDVSKGLHKSQYSSMQGYYTSIKRVLNHIKFSEA